MIVAYHKEALGCAFDEFDRYPTLETAKLACDSDITCGGVYDHYCNDKNFALCPIDANMYDSTSCTYLKCDNEAF